ncbi:hypothetical protein HPP92_028918 [Vanilla planifolia]|uniref:Uncharacterized protein n=1 Tax=Vanilla planifolia TaxID=51239 RepID=A0A835P688_VANPL|nr:hypothetical protein HPP92_028918 [Vanilla planifolia]KAG0446283.1 hypothetical protein HPP92_028908 [Vanilla planifolia]
MHRRDNGRREGRLHDPANMWRFIQSETSCDNFPGLVFSKEESPSKRLKSGLHKAEHRNSRCRRQMFDGSVVSIFYE